ncbi:PAS domain-containing sensor histidine kinase [Parasphingopyxis marina]|uniref:PAS domain-containing sensor histidine kinase n=1 Tax=Parasphingopyxis marina TaxID=2761622 RepID=UPI001C8DFFB6|nr:PAS domain-containing sensor histidine kinase [Parasphingopyxis marina]
MGTDTEERYGLTWRVTPDLLGILSTSGLFESTNPAWFATLGYEAEEIESRPFFDFVHEDDIPRTEEAFEDIQHGKPVLRFRNRYRHKDGSFRWLSWNCVPEGGKFYCSARDVTSSVENRLALTSKEEEARLREQFIAVLGHDLRNPLAALQSGLHLMGKEALSDRGKTVIAAGQRSIDRMSGLIDALMDFARTRLGSGLSLDISDGEDLREAIEATVDEIRIVHPEARIDSRYSLQADVRCDVGRISQLCSNLISNAVTHGDGRTPVELVAESCESGLQIIVSNRGETMPERVIAHLFEPFVREQMRPSQEGLGLGLFICSEIAKAHGGTLSVESTDGLTVFTFGMGNDVALG